MSSEGTSSGETNRALPGGVEITNEMVDRAADSLIQSVRAHGAFIGRYTAEEWVRAHLAVAAPLIEAAALRAAAEYLDGHIDSYELVARLIVDSLKAKGKPEEEIRQRQRLERRYVRGMGAAIQDLYELAEGADERADEAQRKRDAPPVAAVPPDSTP